MASLGGKDGLARAPGQLHLPQEIYPSSPVDLLTLCVHTHPHTHTEAGDVRDLRCFLGFVLIKSNPSGEEINLELLGWETQDAGGLC